MFSFKRKIGNQAEDLALLYLQRQGLQLITKNYLTKLGEIDIIMLDKSDNLLVFVEVRYRKNNFYGKAVETVNYVKQKKIINTAQIYMQNNPIYKDFICRFDVIGIEYSLKYSNIQWIKGIFDI